MEDKPESSLVVSFGKALNGTQLIIKERRFNAKNELMEALLIKRIMPSKYKTWSFTRSEIACACISLRGAVLKRFSLSIVSSDIILNLILDLQIYFALTESP